MVRERTAHPTEDTPSVLTDPAARDRLVKAAEAAGLDSLEALADLVVDSGLLATPPSDGVTERYTLEDLGVQMRSQLPATGRPEWFKGLVETQQVALVAVLRSRGFSTTTISNDFGLDPIAVGKIYARYADDLGAQVVNVRLNTLVGHMQLAAERASEGAMGKEDWGTYWRIQKETIAVLQSLGIVKKAIQKVEVAHTFDDQKSAELEAILDIERKQHARREEMKTAEFEVLDPIPPLALPAAPGSMEVPYDDSE